MKRLHILISILRRFCACNLSIAPEWSKTLSASLAEKEVAEPFGKTTANGTSATWGGTRTTAAFNLEADMVDRMVALLRAVLPVLAG